MTNIYQTKMNSKDLAEINQDQASIIPHGEHFDNSDWIRGIRKKLESPPTKVLQNKYAGNSKYVPIDEIESTLDSIFGPMNWHTSNFQFYKIGGTSQGKALMGCSIELKIINRNFESPVWVTYVGTSSGYVSEKQGETFLPKLKAEAFKNATKQIGNRFGRNLNRKVRDTSYKDQLVVDLTQEINQSESIIDLENIIQNGEISEEVKYAALAEYQKKWLELFRASLKEDLSHVISRISFEETMKEYQEKYPAARSLFQTDKVCIDMLTEIAEKYPRG